MNKRVLTLVAVAFCPLIAFLGCAPPAAQDTGPSYSELVITYNAELAALDRLEEKRKQLIADFEASQQPDMSDAMKMLEGVIGSAEGLELTPEDLNDPQKLLDKVAERSASADDVAAQLEGVIGADSETESGEVPSGDAASDEATVAFETQLAKLDTEIAAQTARVERAREARDAAEDR